MARADKKQTYGIAIKHEDGTVYEFTFTTTEIVKQRWIESELNRRVGAISSWFDDSLNDLSISSTEEIHKLLEEDSWIRFINVAQHIKDILNELEIDFALNVKHEDPLAKEESENAN